MSLPRQKSPPPSSGRPTRPAPPLFLQLRPGPRRLPTTRTAASSGSPPASTAAPSISPTRLPCKHRHLRAPPYEHGKPRDSLMSTGASPIIPAHLANESRPNSSRADAAPGDECKAAGSPSYEFPHSCIVLQASSRMVLLASSLRAPSVPTELR
jgi:hypothetical protein